MALCKRPVCVGVSLMETAAQVKEKFGGLRFYVDGGDDWVYGAISMAESMSYRTCEVCGAPGVTRGEGWIRTTCDQHSKPTANTD